MLYTDKINKGWQPTYGPGHVIGRGCTPTISIISIISIIMLGAAGAKQAMRVRIISKANIVITAIT